MDFDLNQYKSKRRKEVATTTVPPSGKRKPRKAPLSAHISEEVMHDKRLDPVAFKLLAVLILEQFKSWNKSEPLVCADLSEYGIGRMNKHRGLIRLERLGYVRVERHATRAPRVWLLL
jgi:hypothetical protein